MKTHAWHWMIVASFAALLLVSCATVLPPAELVRARDAYREASNGPAATLNPADLHDSRVLLMNAEEAAKSDPQGAQSRHLAYLAERRAQLASAQGRTSQAKQDELAADERAQTLKDAAKDRKIADTQNALALTQEQAEKAQAEAQRNEMALSGARGDLKEKQTELDSERDARLEAEKKAQDAMDALRKLAAVKEESRGTVITLSGSVLFASGRSALLPSAERSLNDVSAALLADKRHILIEGHTDSRGSDATNQLLSEARALSVRDYLISRGIPRDRIRAVGLGSSHPIEDNGTAEGRANNRRVEIILENPRFSSADN